MRSRPLALGADFQSAFPIEKPRLQGSGRATHKATARRNQSKSQRPKSRPDPPHPAPALNPRIASSDTRSTTMQDDTPSTRNTTTDRSSTTSSEASSARAHG